MGWDRAFARLDEIAGHGPDWDGLDSAAPDPNAVCHARNLCDGMRRAGFPPPGVTAGVNGTVYLDWSAPGAYLEVECDGRSQAAAVGHIRAVETAGVTSPGVR